MTDSTGQDSAYKCECQDGFYGARCEQKVDNCTNGVMNCFNGGVCIQGFDNAYCKCPNEQEVNFMHINMLKFFIF